MITPFWVLAIVYWLHFLATIVWLGGQALLAWLKLHEMTENASQPFYGELVSRYQTRIASAGWLSLLVLTATGLFQMSSNINYHGFLAIINVWAAAILIKHILFAGLVCVNLYLSWGLNPALARTRLRYQRGLTAAGELVLRLQNQEMLLLRISLGTTLVILIFTALARAA